MKKVMESAIEINCDVQGIKCLAGSDDCRELIGTLVLGYMFSTSL